jgi:serine/threonine protein phosphatase 1
MRVKSPALAPSRLYVIGDIHGRLDLLERMIAMISRDLNTRPLDDCLTVTLGDYIDRGPESRGVIERLATNPFPTPFVALKGNHEDLLETFLADPPSADLWRRNGGLETLHSYGVDVGQLMRGRDYERTADTLRTAMPAAHLTFLAALPLTLTVGRYFLCHAGVRPGVPLPQQSEEDLLWIRDEFLYSTADFGKVVVHGHSPSWEPEHLHNRINVDTGAFMTGRLTCAVLEGNDVRFLTASD